MAGEEQSARRSSETQAVLDATTRGKDEHEAAAEIDLSKRHAARGTKASPNRSSPPPASCPVLSSDDVFQKTSARYRAVEPSSGSNVIPKRARPGLVGLRPHTCRGWNSRLSLRRDRRQRLTTSYNF